MVVAVCITANRQALTEKAIACFLAQDYQDKRLFIFDTGDAPMTVTPSPLINHYWEKRRLHDTIGSLRNRANAKADMVFDKADLIAHWDSDDYSAPGRLTDQVNRLRKAGKACTGYHNIKFTDGKKWWLYHGDVCYAVGTSLLYKTSWWEKHLFADTSLGEDNQFVGEAWAQNQLISADGADMMWALIHPGNTAPKVPRDNWELLS